MINQKKMEQGSTEWHEWRIKGIGATDAAVILGVSKYKTPYELWEEKTRREIPENKTNWAMERGSHYEPIARANYELKHGTEMPPALMQHERFPFLRASLDGYNEKEGIILEIKCPGASDHSLAKAGKIPEKYIPQLSHQLLVTGASRVDYFSFDGTAGVCVQFYPDVEYIKKLLAAELDFWKLVECGEPPEFCDRDFKKVQSKEIKSSITIWRKHYLKLKSLEKLESEWRKKILALSL